MQNYPKHLDIRGLFLFAIALGLGIVVAAATGHAVWQMWVLFVMGIFLGGFHLLISMYHFYLEGQRLNARDGE